MTDFVRPDLRDRMTRLLVPRWVAWVAYLMGGVGGFVWGLAVGVHFG